MSKFVFIHFDGDYSVEHKVPGDRAWNDVVEDMISFLKGCGFQMTREDIADYLNEGREFSSDYEYPEYAFDNTMFSHPDGSVSTTAPSTVTVKVA